MRFSVPHCHTLTMQSWKHSTSWARPSKEKQKRHSVKSLGLITKEAIIFPLASDKILWRKVKKLLFSCIFLTASSWKWSLCCFSSSKGLRGIRQSTRENCTDSLQAEVRKHLKGKKTDHKFPLSYIRESISETEVGLVNYWTLEVS